MTPKHSPHVRSEPLPSVPEICTRRTTKDAYAEDLVKGGFCCRDDVLGGKGVKIDLMGCREVAGCAKRFPHEDIL